MFIAMKDCVDPKGHEWRATSFTTSAGSTPVRCIREGCEETGFRLDAPKEKRARRALLPEKMAQNLGRTHA